MPRGASTFDLLRTLADVQTLVDSAQRESETLEYKTASARLTDADFKELAKDASAFANSSGGLLVYGIATSDRRDKTKPTGVEPILQSNIDVILQVISTHVRRPIAGMRWKTIEGADGTPVCLLIDVPASQDAPHQVAVRDHRYYRRHGAVSEPMSHDLVELYFGRRLGPLLEPSLWLSGSPSGAPLPHSEGVFRIGVNVHNVGQRTAKHLAMIAFLPAIPALRFVETLRGPTVVDTTVDGIRRCSIAIDDRVVHVGLEVNLFYFIMDLRSDWARWLGTPCMYVTVYADEMRSQGIVAMVAQDDQGRFRLQTSDASADANRKNDAPPDEAVE